jgi:uncharacterized OB-fold protein
MKPLPTALPLERPYWDHAREHRLALQRCSACGVFRFPASPVCAECSSDQFAWVPTKGSGTLVSWVVFHKSYFTSFNDEIPYNVALVKIDEGPVLCANVVGVENDRLGAGMRLKVVFEDVNETFSIPKFAPL